MVAKKYLVLTMLQVYSFLKVKADVLDMNLAQDYDNVTILSR